MTYKLSIQNATFSSSKYSLPGHVISPDGIATDPSKTEKITDWPTTQNVQEVRQFLGLTSYYQRFIQSFAGIARPLHRLTEQDKAFKWTIECENDFVKLKLCLHSSPNLAFPDFSLPFRYLPMWHWSGTVSNLQGWSRMSGSVCQ